MNFLIAKLRVTSRSERTTHDSGNDRAKLEILLRQCVSVDVSVCDRSVFDWSLYRFPRRLTVFVETPGSSLSIARYTVCKLIRAYY